MGGLCYVVTDSDTLSIHGHALCPVWTMVPSTCGQQGFSDPAFSQQLCTHSGKRHLSGLPLPCFASGGVENLQASLGGCLDTLQSQLCAAALAPRWLGYRLRERCHLPRLHLEKRRSAPWAAVFPANRSKVSAVSSFMALRPGVWGAHVHLLGDPPHLLTLLIASEFSLSSSPGIIQWGKILKNIQ